MGESYEIWKKIETIWNEGPERVKKENKILIDAPSTVKTPPPYETAVITVQNNAQTSSNLYPSFLLVLVHTPPS